MNEMSNKQLTIKDLSLCQTEDASWTVLHTELDAHYRSTHGAESESEWVFIQGTQLYTHTHWNIGELGFGLGTNLHTVLMNHSNLNEPPPLHYIGIDHQPIPASILEDVLPASPQRDWLMELLLQIECGQTVALVKVPEHNIRLELHATDLKETRFPNNWATAFFHDPFGPKTNPEAWTLDTFSRIRHCMTEKGVLATYGAAGHARRALAAAGFWIASTKGFGRKREMTIASPSLDGIAHGTLIRKYPAFMVPKP